MTSDIVEHFECFHHDSISTTLRLQVEVFVFVQTSQTPTIVLTGISIDNTPSIHAGPTASPLLSMAIDSIPRSPVNLLDED